jgi:hypothetical protein
MFKQRHESSKILDMPLPEHNKYIGGFKSGPFKAINLNQPSFFSSLVSQQLQQQCLVTINKATANKRKLSEALKKRIGG